MKDKGEKERYIHLNAEFQRIARRAKKAILSEKCKEIEETIEWERLESSSIKLEIPSLSHSVVFFYFFSLIAEEGFLSSPCYSLELFFEMSIIFLFSFAFRFSSFHS